MIRNRKKVANTAVFLFYSGRITAIGANFTKDVPESSGGGKANPVK